MKLIYNETWYEDKEYNTGKMWVTVKVYAPAEDDIPDLHIILMENGVFQLGEYKVVHHYYTVVETFKKWEVIRKAIGMIDDMVKSIHG